MHMPVRVQRACTAVVTAVLISMPARAADGGSVSPLDSLAEQYVRLVLAVGEHAPNMVDAYYGPSQWREEARASARTLDALASDAGRLAAQLEAARTTDAQSELRRRGLREQVASVRARLAILGGERLPFDEEARRVYGVAPPHHDDDYYRAIHRELDAIVPGEGPLGERMEAFKKRFVIPPEHIAASAEAALEACRVATRAHAELPPGESFQVAQVTDKPWGAYNWYQGGYQSRIEFNVSTPIYANRIALTVCHESYPGHHVLNSLLERHLVKDRGWLEYTVYPLFSSESLLAEGTADFGVSLVFPGDTLWRWERDHLFPIAGVDPSLAELSHRIRALSERLDYARIDAARAYLDGTRSGPETVAWLQEFTFATAEEAGRSLRFFETYRAYVVNYRLGEDLVRQYVDRVAGTDPEARWNAFLKLLAAPPIVADLARGTSLDPGR